MKLYRVTIDVSEAKLQAVVGCLAGEGQNLSVAEVEAPHNRRRVVSRNAAPVRNTNGAAADTRTGKIYLDYLRAHGPSKIGAIALEFERQGFNKKSASPLTSRLMAEGKIVRGNDGLVALTPS